MRLLRADEGYGEDGKISADIPPAMKAEVRRLVAGDVRLGSFTRFVRTAIAFYLLHYKKAQGQVDRDNFPIPGKPQ
jgi:hypothetical protein